MSQLYRAAWLAAQDDGRCYILTGAEGESITDAMAERDRAAALPDVEEAWLETSFWQRIASSSEGSA